MSMHEGTAHAAVDERVSPSAIVVDPARDHARSTPTRFRAPAHPDTALPDTALRSAGPRVGRTRLLLAAYALSGAAGALIIVASAPVWRLATPTWRLTVPGIPHPGGSMVSAVLFVTGLVLLWVGWVGLVGRAERMPGTETRRLAVMAVILAVWAIPPLLGPPLLSNDVYSYAAQGEMAARGIDPTAKGPYALHRGEFLFAVDPIWRDAPAPYGPVAVQLSEWTVRAAGHDPAGTIWLWRLMTTMGVAMTAVGVVVIARQHGASPAVALVAGAGGPLVALHLIGGIHNDALMVGLLTLGLASFGAGRRALAVLAITLAVAVKLPAAVALAFIGWNWYGRDAHLTQRLRSSLLVVGASAGLLIVMTWAAGIGFGWLTALRDTGKVTSTLSATTKVGFLAGDLARLLGFDVAPDAFVGAFRFLGLATAAAVCAWLLWRSPNQVMVRSIGVAMIVIVLLGPVVWPWYLPAGFALVAATGLGRFRPTFLVLVVAASALVWPTSIDPVRSLQDHQHLLGLGAVIGIALACVLAQRGAAWLADRRELRAARAAGRVVRIDLARR